MTGIKYDSIKFYRKNRKTILAILAYIKEKHLILLCLTAVFTANSNQYFCTLPLVIMMMCTDKFSRYICGAITVLGFTFSFIHTAFYVPCVAFSLIYLLGYYMLQQTKVKAEWFATAVYTFGKLYVLSFGYDNVYYAVYMLEVVLLIFMPQISIRGCRQLKECKINPGAFQLFEAAATLLIFAISLGGIKIYGFNLPVCFLFSAAIYYALKDSMALSLVAFICTAVTVCQDKNFSYLFVGLFAIYLGGSALLNRKEKGYIATVILAVVVSLLFITKFNSLVFLTVTAVSLASAFIAYKFYPQKQLEATADNVGEKEYLQLTQQLEKLEQCFSFLGNTVIDISNLMTKEDIPKDISDIVAQKICRRCKNNTLCWQQNYSYTQKQFSNYAYNIHKGKKAEFDGLLLSRCQNTAQLSAEFIQAEKLENTKQIISRNGRHNQKILQNQFLTISQVLQDITRQTVCTGVVNSTYTYAINRFITSMGKTYQYCLCSQNKDKCVISTTDYYDDDLLERIRLKLENLYGEKFSPPQKSTVEEEIIYTFCQMPQYICEFAAQNKSRYGICGDICNTFSHEQYTYVILADGMGTGSYAAAESRTAIVMLENLLSSGVKVEIAVEITNTAMNLKGTGQACVALDILQVDCYSGDCIIYKAGGAPSWVMDKGRVKKVYKESLPIGILKDTNLQQLEFSMDNGGQIIMLSDGVNITEELACKLHLMKDKLTVEETARRILECTDTTDDATAVVIRIVRK